MDLFSPKDLLADETLRQSNEEIDILSDDISDISDINEDTCVRECVCECVCECGSQSPEPEDQIQQLQQHQKYYQNEEERDENMIVYVEEICNDTDNDNDSEEKNNVMEDSEFKKVCASFVSVDLVENLTWWASRIGEYVRGKLGWVYDDEHPKLKLKLQVWDALHIEMLPVHAVMERYKVSRKVADDTLKIVHRQYLLDGRGLSYRCPHAKHGLFRLYHDEKARDSIFQLNAKNLKSIADKKYEPWCKKMVKHFSEMKYLKDIVIRRSKYVVSDEWVLLCEDFHHVLNNVDMCDVSVNIYAIYTNNIDEAIRMSSPPVVIRQKLEIVGLRHRELYKTQGEVGDYVYICVPDTSEVSIDSPPIVYVELLEGNEHMPGKAWHGVSANLNEATGRVPRRFAWTSDEVTLPSVHIEEACPLASVDFSNAKNFPSKIGHLMMELIVYNYTPQYDITGVAFPNGHHDFLIKNSAKLILRKELLNQKMNSILNYFYDCDMRSSSQHWFPLLFNVKSGGIIGRVVNRFRNVKLTRRVDSRVFKAVTDSKVELYVRNVFLKGIIKSGTIQQLEYFLDIESVFYKCEGIDVINDFIYDTTSRPDTPLLAALGFRKDEIVQWLLAHGADTRTKNVEMYSGLTALQCAERMNYSAAVVWIKESMGDICTARCVKSHQVVHKTRKRKRNIRECSISDI